MNYIIPYNNNNNGIYDISYIIDTLSKSIYKTNDNILIIDNMYCTIDYDKIDLFSDYIELAISYIDVVECYKLEIIEIVDYNQITNVHKLEEIFYSIRLELKLF